MGAPTPLLGDPSGYVIDPAPDLLAYSSAHCQLAASGHTLTPAFGTVVTAPFSQAHPACGKLPEYFRIFPLTSGFHVSG